MKKKIIEKQIKEQIESLSDLILNNSGIFREYTDDELVNSSFIFMEVFMSKMYEYNNEQKFGLEQQEILVTEAGKSLRQTIRLFTNIDLHQVCKQT